MSNARNETKATHKTSDRRRFDADGQPRSPSEDVPPAEVTAKEEAPPAVASAESVAQEAPPAADQTAQLTAQLEAARKRIDDLARAYQAVEKDREDFKARLNRERERMIDVEKGNVSLSLIEALDELDLCVANADDSPLASGVRLVRANLLKKLLGIGVELIVLEGTRYDPNLAEAVDMELTANPDDDQKITKVIRAGYAFKERVVRPARVTVARYVKPADA